MCSNISSMCSNISIMCSNISSMCSNSSSSSIIIREQETTGWKCRYRSGACHSSIVERVAIVVVVVVAIWEY